METELETTRDSEPTAEASDEFSRLLAQAIKSTKQTSQPVAKDLLNTLIDAAMKGVVTYDRNVTNTIENAIATIEAKISDQLNAIMHDPKFQALEGSWRGLKHMVESSDGEPQVKIKLMQISKRELARDLSRNAFDQSETFKKIYENGIGAPGGEPFAALIGDYEFTNRPADIDTLRQISTVAAASFAPFVSAAGPELLGMDSFRDLPKARDMKTIFESTEFARWRGFRESEDSRFVSLVMPRVLARAPYGSTTNPIEEFRFEEAPLDEKTGNALPMEPDQFCWMNASFVLGAKMTQAFAETGWGTSIRGAGSGGKVENLPTYMFENDEGGSDQQCPTEVAITDRREKELSDLGFIPLCHYKNTDYAVFFGGQTVQKPMIYSTPEATANAALSARLPYIMITSRVAHYLKQQTRDQIGSYAEARKMEQGLTQWIHKYTNSIAPEGEQAKAEKPFRNAKIVVAEIPGKPGSYTASAHLQPWFQLEEVTAELSMVANVPVSET